MEGFGAPQSYAAQWYPGLLRPEGAWHVVMNNWKHIQSFPDRVQAERRAAQLNYSEGCYPRLHALESA